MSNLECYDESLSGMYRTHTHDANHGFQFRFFSR